MSSIYDNTKNVLVNKGYLLGHDFFLFHLKLPILEMNLFLSTFCSHRVRSKQETLFYSYMLEHQGSINRTPNALN